MGPESRSLARLSETLRFAGDLACFLLIAATAAVAEDSPRPTDLIEQQDVHRVQIDVSVIDPRGADLASVPGLGKNDFILRLDGVPLTPAQFDRVEFDEICPGHNRAPLESDALLPDARPTLIVFADLNFLSTSERQATARAIRDLAALLKSKPMKVKVVAYARRIVDLTSGFTSRPDALLRAADGLVGIVAAGPPQVGRALPTRGPNDPVEASPLESEADVSRPRERLDSDRRAFDFNRAARLFEPLERGSAVLPNMVEPTVDVRPSLTALEAVMLSHSAIRGRKALVVFANQWFDLDDGDMLRDAIPPRRAAQGGFTIWSVDPRGLGEGSPGSESKVLSFLSSSTGGQLIRSVGRLSVAFDRALEQLSCYYLFSIPLPRPKSGTREHEVSVRLRTTEHPERWYYRVRSVSAFTLLDPSQLSARRRLAALLEPDAHRFPEVRVTASYPAGTPPATVIEMGTVLSDLSFLPSGARRGLSARFSLEGMVTDGNGRTVCSLGDAIVRTVRTELQPERFPPSLLVVGEKCVLPGPGTYEVRVVVEDRTAESVGAARARLEFARLEPGLARLSSLRVGRNSGRDFLLDGSVRNTTRDVSRDRERAAFIPLDPGEPVVPKDRVKLRFVVCGLAGIPKVTVVSSTGTKVTDAPVSARGEQRGGDFVCREFEAGVAENVLSPGSYRFSVLDPGAEAEAGRELGAAPFDVVAPDAGPRNLEIPGQET